MFFCAGHSFCQYFPIIRSVSKQLCEYRISHYHKIKGSDFAAVKQTYKEAPGRVVTANASSIELLYNLGLSDRIAGTVAIDNAPGDDWKELYDSLNILGDKMTISKEVIAAAQPDLIIGRSATFAEGTFGSIPELNELGINGYAQKASDMSTDVSMQSIIDDVRALGEIFDVQDKANPDVIIYVTADRNAESDAKAVESMKNEEILASVPAVENNKIIEVPYDAFMDYGVRNFDTLEELSDFLYN